MKMLISVRIEAMVRATQNHVVEINVDNPNNQEEIERKALEAAIDKSYGEMWNREIPRHNDIHLYDAITIDY